MKADFGSVKQHTTIDDDPDACAVLYRSKIDRDDAEISLCTISVRILMAFVRADSDRWKVVPFGEIFINPSDPKHVMELLGCSGGLGMVMTTRMLRWDAFDGL